MPQIIDEIATYDRVRVGRNVTDLLWFYEQWDEAAEMTRAFLFSVASNLARPLIGGQDYDSLEILWHILNSYDRTAHSGTGDTGALESAAAPLVNRFVVIGGYGWGKSSLALVAANFLGLPDDHSGRTAVVDALDPESSDAPKQLVDKRNAHKVKFTICLKGQNRDFHELLVAAVAQSKALYADLLQRAGIELSVRSEFEAAADWLKALQQEEALLRVLDGGGRELSRLLTDLSHFKKEALDRADSAWRAYNRVGPMARPVWYQQTDTARYIGELVQALTKDPASPFDGVLILFDELGLWLEYANDDQSAAGGPAFLNFMEAVPRYAGKLTVCSFIQADIEAFVGMDTASNNVRHMSERLGARVRYKPDLELVFQSAVKDKVRGARAELWRRNDSDFVALSELLSRSFPRYRSGTWVSVPGRVKEVLVKKCWPIHPFMVAAVCHLRFGQGVRVISILESQFHSLGRELSEDDAHRLRWSLPVDVVDFYQANFENLHSADGERNLWARYQAATIALRGRDTPIGQRVLKAVFLCHALSRDLVVDTTDDFPAIVAAFAGIETPEADATLKELGSSRDGHSAVLLGDENSGWYEFFGASESPVEARSAVVKMYESSDGFDFAVEAINSLVMRQCGISPGIFAQQRNVQVHSFDTCYEAVIDLPKLSANYIVDLVRTNIATSTDPDTRGVHLVVLFGKEKLPKGLAHGDGTLNERIKGRCQDLLNEAWRKLKNGGFQVPVALTVPNEPHDELYRALALWRSADQLPLEDRRRLGEGLTAFKDTELKKAERLAQALRAAARLTLLTPTATTADPELQTLKRNAATRNLVMASFFEAVYSLRPPLNSSTLGRDGTKFVQYCHSLFLFLIKPDRQKQMPSEHANALDSVLMAEPGLEGRSWLAIERRDAAFDVIPPKDPYAAQCYVELERLFGATQSTEAVTLSKVFTKLSRAPFGLDVRSFILLLGIWYANHRDECILQLQQSGETSDIGWDEVARQCERRATLFGLVESDKWLVRVRDTASELAELRGILQELESWSGEEKSGQKLLDRVAALEGHLPTASEWSRIKREALRVSNKLSHDTSTVSEIEALKNDIVRHFRLDNALDSVRRLVALVGNDESSLAVRTATAGCFSELRKRIVAAVNGVVSSRFDSPEVETHELTRTKDMIAALTTDPGAEPKWGAESVEALAGITKRIDEALETVAKRHAASRAKQAALEAFRQQVQRIVESPDERSHLKDIRGVQANLTDLGPQCPEEARREFNTHLSNVKRQIQILESEVTACLSTFASIGPVLADILRVESRAKELLEKTRDTDEGAKIQGVLEASGDLRAAAEVYRGGVESSSFEDLKSCSDRLATLSKGGNAAGTSIVARWAEEIANRAREHIGKANTRAKQLSTSLAAAKDVKTLIRLAGEIRRFIDVERVAIPEPCTELETALRQALTDQAPVEIAAILRAIPKEQREAAVTLALKFADEN